MHDDLKYFFTSNDHRILIHTNNCLTHQIGFKFTKFEERIKNDYEIYKLAKKNISKFSFIMIYENLDDDVKKYFSCEIGKYNIIPKYNDFIDENIYDLIKKNNELDIKLYNDVLHNLGGTYLKYLILL